MGGSAIFTDWAISGTNDLESEATFHQLVEKAAVIFARDVANVTEDEPILYLLDKWGILTTRCRPKLT